MDFKRIIRNGLIIAAVMAVIAILPGLGEYLLMFLMPPRIYIILGLLILAALVTIIRNQRGRGDDE